MVPGGRHRRGDRRRSPRISTAGDAIIDGGNTLYVDDIARAAALAPRGIDYVDCGTSGGVFGLERGFCLMIGGPDDVGRSGSTRSSARSRPGSTPRERTPGRTGDPAPEEMGYLHCGPAGAGHFVKMVHNGIEYALMAAYAEGLNDPAPRQRRHAHAARPTPRPRRSRDPELYQYDLDVAKVAEVWRRGSVVASWLLDLTAAALQESPDARRISAAG